MGCALTSLRPSSEPSPPTYVPLYQFHDPQECLNLTFNYDKTKATAKTAIPFNDREVISKARSAYHIESIVVEYGKLIQGIQVTYQVDGELRVVSHNMLEGQMKRVSQEDRQSLLGVKNRQAVMKTEEFEHIEFLDCTYS